MEVVPKKMKLEPYCDEKEGDLVQIIYEHSKSNNEYKRCTKCGEFKTLKDNFYKRKTGKYDTYCRECKNEQNRKRLKERYWNDEQYREQKKEKRRSATP